MKHKQMISTIALLLTFLNGCGGGGGGTATPVQVASTQTFNLQAAYRNFLSTPASFKFTISGSYGAYPVSGSGTAVAGAITSGMFEGQSALQRTTSILGSFSANNQTIPIATSTILWMDSNYMPRGQISGSYYEVADGTPSIPIAVKVNDTGAIYATKRYATAAKTSLIGTSTTSYLVEADTPTTALVTLISTGRNNSGSTIATYTDQYRITTANTLIKIKETALDNSAGINLVMSFGN